MKKKLVFLIAISHFYTLLAQDSTRFYDKIKLSWESYDYYAPNEAKTYLVPDYIISRRDFGKYVTDNPLFHGATAFGLRLESDIIKNYHVDVRFIGEHRGISYGAFNTASMVVYPIFNFSFVDTIKLFNAKWIVSGRAGQERDFQQGEGLYLYNLNCHAERMRLQVAPHVIFEAFHIGDLINGIGLRLDEVYQGSVIFPNISLSKNDKKRLDVQLALTQWKGGYASNYRNFRNPNETIFLPEIMATLHINSDTRAYTHFSFKPVKTPYQTDSAVYYTPQNMDKFAAVVGFKNRQKTDKLTIETVAEARFYGKSFNFERSDRGSFYRGRYRFTAYNATIGENLYPLSSYDRPFSQWGVFTEYYNKNVGGLTIRTKGNWQIKDAWHLYFDLDYNAIFAENEQPFHYLFASSGLNYKFRMDIDAGIGLTNKGMNLDLFYPTFYFYRQPSVFIFLKKTLTP